MSALNSGRVSDCASASGSPGGPIKKVKGLKFALSIHRASGVRVLERSHEAGWSRPFETDRFGHENSIAAPCF
jgi:hypothetical protein